MMFQCPVSLGEAKTRKGKKEDAIDLNVVSATFLVFQVSRFFLLFKQRDINFFFKGILDKAVLMI